MPPNTPLARYLRARGISGMALARRLGVGQPAISRAIRHCQLTLELAVRICDELDPERAEIDERYLLLPKIAPARYAALPLHGAAAAADHPA